MFSSFFNKFRSVVRILGTTEKVTDAIGFVSDKVGAASQIFKSEFGRAAAGALNALGGNAPTKIMIELAKDPGLKGLFSKYTKAVQTVMKGNLNIPWTAAVGEVAQKTKEFFNGTNLFYDLTKGPPSTGTLAGVLGFSLDNKVSPLVVAGVVGAPITLGKNVNLPSIANHSLRGAGIASLVGQVLTSKAQAEGVLKGSVEKGITIKTSLSNVNAALTVGSNMANLTIGGIPLGGSTSKLALNLPSALTYGAIGELSGQPTLKITSAMLPLPTGSAIGVGQNTYILNLFNPAAYNTGAATSGGRFLGGAGAEIAAALVTNDYVSSGIIDSLGQIEAGGVDSLGATAGTSKGGSVDAFGHPDDADGLGLDGGSMGDNTGDGTSAGPDAAGGFGNA